MKSYRLSELSRAELDGLKARPRIDFSSIFSDVSNFSSLCNVDTSHSHFKGLSWQALMYYAPI